MEATRQSLDAAAIAGTIDNLYTSIRQAPDILDHIDGIPFVDTPIHRAASAGQTHFAREILSMKPSLGRKLNPDGFSPLHLALRTLKDKKAIQDWQNNEESTLQIVKLTKTVKQLVKFDGELVRVRGRDMLTPLHLVAQEDEIDLLVEFLRACPASIEDVTVRDETAVHIAVKNSRIRALQVLLEWLRENRIYRPVLNRGDEEGNTVLHIAASNSQPQIVESLVEELSVEERNLKNGENSTALDIAGRLGPPNEAAKIQIMSQLARVAPIAAHCPTPTMEDTRRSLDSAAEAGDVGGLYDLLKLVPGILGYIDEKPFVDTPLHIAVKAGQTHFAIEILSLNPSLGRKLNPDGFSPLHLALQTLKDKKGIPDWQNNQELKLQIEKLTKTVKQLVKFDSELIRVRGRERLTPLHLVAQEDEIHLLTQFLLACPGSIEDVTVRCETALHIAVKSSRIRAFQKLLKWVRETGNYRPLLNWGDEEGNTILHIAAAKSQPQIVESLVKELSVKERNKKNDKNSTALDIARKLGPPNEAARTQIMNALKSHLLTIYAFGAIMRTSMKTELSMEMRNMILVVAVLIATATYQAVLTPPGDGDWYLSFYIVNTFTFISSITVMIFVLPMNSITLMLNLTLFFLTLTYGFILSYLMSINWIAGIANSSMFFLYLSLAFIYFVYFIRVVHNNAFHQYHGKIIRN